MTSDEGMTATVALAAGFAIGRSPDITVWWQYLIVAIIIAVFLTRVWAR